MTTRVEWADARTISIDANPDLVAKSESHVKADIDRLTITVSEKIYDVRSEQAVRWVAVLLSAPGRWFSSADLEATDGQLIKPRTNVLKTKLPAHIARMIDSERGRGSRIRLPRA